MSVRVRVELTPEEALCVVERLTYQRHGLFSKAWPAIAKILAAYADPIGMERIPLCVVGGIDPRDAAIDREDY
jgi:hypothetical protein